jgi:hypothetical protein
MRRFLVVATVVALSLVASGVALAQNDAHIGTWKLNVAKSKFASGLTYKSETRTYEPTADGYRFTGESVSGDGSTHNSSFSVKYDNKDYPYTGDRYGADTLAVKLIDANHIDSTLKKSGKLLYTAKVVVSKDGKVMTITAKGTDADGHAFSDMRVFDKQ